MRLEVGFDATPIVTVVVVLVVAFPILTIQGVEIHFGLLRLLLGNQIPEN